MHVDRANLIMWYLSIRWFDLEAKHTVAIIRISRSLLWYAMKRIIHAMQKQNDACNAKIIFWVHGWSLQSSSMIKSWVQNRVSTQPIFKNHDYPLTDFSRKPYRFTSEWYVNRKWLEYSIDKDAVFCLYCYLFGQDVGK